VVAAAWGRDPRACAAASGIERLNTAAQTTAIFIFRIVPQKAGKVSYSRGMAVDPELLEILACPNCKTPVTLIKNGTSLRCATSHGLYPIKDDIPVMLTDEAPTEND